MSLLTNCRHWPFCLPAWTFQQMPACHVGMIRDTTMAIKAVFPAPLCQWSTYWLPVTNQKLLPAWGKEHVVYK